MKTVSADILFLVDKEPIKNGYVSFNEEGTILEFGEINNSISIDEHFNGAICPGFVNAHCHLELSFMFEKIPTHTGLIDFIKHVVELRNQFTKEEEQTAISKGEQQMWENGIMAVGDISNDTRSFAIKEASNLRFHTFVEVFDFQPNATLEYIQKGKDVYEAAPKQNGNTASITPHAPYSCTPTLVNFCDRFSSDHTPILSIHNQEHPQENQYFIDKTGTWNQLFKDWEENQDWFYPANKTSIQAIGECLTKRNTILFVHNTFTSAQDVAWAHNNLKEAYFCSCPNANQYIENNLPNYDELIEAGAKLCLGTDSLASNWQLSILEEMKTVKKHFTHIPTTQLLQWACLNGATALQFNDKLGSITVGKQPGLVHISNLDENFELTAESKEHRIC